MRPFSSTISLDEAKRRLHAGVRPIDRVERVGLDRAGGRVAAAEVTSDVDVPPFTRSAMDGYAVVAAETATATADAPARLRLVDRVFTGELATESAGGGRCIETRPARRCRRARTRS